MKKIPFLILAFCTLWVLPLSAQFQGKVFVEDSSVKIFQGVQQKALAWAGGLNNPQYSVADLNQDGLNDLVIFQPDQFSIKTFINSGSAANPKYNYRPEYALNFPFCMYYLVMRDYNADGIQDIIEHGGYGFTLHKGYYNAAHQLCFTKYKSLFYNNDKSVTGWINAETNPGDIPAIVDVDHDGDLDFLTYYGDGYYMSWYKNMQVENALPKDSVVIKLVDRCWGKMRQSYLRSHDLGIFCDNSSLMRLGSSMAKITDGGNTPCLIDMDGDGDYDLLDGHRAFNYVTYLENGKYPYGPRDSMIGQDTTFTVVGDTLKIAQWAAPFYVDIDADGKRDLMLSPNAPLSSENYKCSKFYKNIGTDALPNFQYKGDTFLVADMIDVGSNAYPVFYDYNKDSKPDLFIGTKGYYDNSSGQFYGQIMYLENTSTPGNPSFQLITKDFLSLSLQKYKGISIAIGDIDNDNKEDLILGHLDGTLHWVKNTAITTGTTPVWSSAPQLLKDASANPVTCNSYAAPLVYDINADGAPDLLIGDQMGTLFYYENDALGSGVLSLSFKNDNLGVVKTDPEKLSSGHATPFIGKMDNSGKEYLVLGSRSGRIFRYTDFEGGNVFSAYKRIDSAYSEIFSQNYQYTSYMSAPAIADVDADGKYEMLIGNVYGGVLLYHQDKIVTINEQSSQNFKRLEVFPNPAQKEMYIKPTFSHNKRSIYVYNSLGVCMTRIEESNNHKYEKINISDWPDGVYYIISSEAQEQSSTIIIKKSIE